MASEDSDELVPGFLPIHGLDDLRDLDETFNRLVSASGHELHAVGELLEVLLLGATHRILSEKRNYRLQQILTPSHGISVHMLPMVVIPSVWKQISDAEELTKIFETRTTRNALRDRQFVRDLETGPVALPATTVWLPHEAD
jgi:hypothetical protein